MEILCHRGWWEAPQEKNTLTAFEKAFRSGLGIEIDIRDFNGKLVVSHDVPVVENPYLEFSTVLTAWRDFDAPTLAINIKSDGLIKLLSELLNKNDLKKLFFFDMSFPESIMYKKNGFPVADRLSEFESRQTNAGELFWVDSFVDLWWNSDKFKEIPVNSCYLVSPELHGREIGESWEMASQVPQFKGICTDLFQEAMRKFLP